MIHLLDVNVLIALVDRNHVHHDYAHHWIGNHSPDGWATSAISENGTIRIISNANYPNRMKSPAHAAEMLLQLKNSSAHQFWSENVSLLDDRLFQLEYLLSPAQITDVYLLGLAVSHGGNFATFDRRINVAAVSEGLKSLKVLSP